MLRIRNYRSNRKKVFEVGDLRLGASAYPSQEGQNSVVGLELMRLKSGTQSKWETLWSGRVKTDESGATVERKSK
jgi:hypothetical protein